MVAPRRPLRPFVVKPARAKVRPYRGDARRVCVVCKAELRGDHALGDLVCDCHEHVGYDPRLDADLDERILVMLWRAKGEPVNLLRALGTADRDAVRCAVNRLRAAGIPVSGWQHVGYVMGESRTVEGRTRAIPDP